MRAPLPHSGPVCLGLALLIGLAATCARAQISLLLEETGDPSTLAYTFSGSGTWQSTGSRNAGIHFNSNNGSEFVDSTFGSIDIALTGTISNLTSGQDYAITGLRLTHSTNGDDWSILLTSVSGTIGDSYAISGNGFFTLGSQTFANFAIGSSSSNVGTGTTDFGSATLTVQAMAVPEPRTYALALGSAAALLAVARRRKTPKADVPPPVST